MNVKILKEWLAKGIISPTEYESLSGERFESESPKVNPPASPGLVDPDKEEKIKNLGLGDHRIPTQDELKRAEKYASVPKTMEEILDDTRKLQASYIRRPDFYEGPP